MKTLYLILTIITSLYEASAATANDVATIEGLLDFRANRGNVWKDNLTDQPLYRQNASGTYVNAGLDADITLSPFNAATIMTGYLNNPETFPEATSRSSELTSLMADQHWKALFTLVKNYRVSLGRTAKDCLGKDLYELVASEYKPTADMRDITNISTLIDAIAPCIAAASPTGPVAGSPEFSPALLENFERFLAFRATLNKMHCDTRTGQRLYTINSSNALVAAADDSDVKSDLSNLVDLMCNAATRGMSASSPSSGAACDILSDPNVKRLYDMIETYRKNNSFFSKDAAGRTLHHEDRTPSVDMNGITDKTNLFRAIFQFFAESLRPAL